MDRIAPSLQGHPFIQLSSPSPVSPDTVEISSIPTRRRLTPLLQSSLRGVIPEHLSKGALVRRVIPDDADARSSLSRLPDDRSARFLSVSPATPSSLGVQRFGAVSANV